MLKKLPLENQLLQCLSSIDPIAILSRFQKTLQQLLKFYEQVDSIFKDVADCYEYERECRAIMIDVDLPQHEDVRVDNWWTKLIEHYPNLSKVALAMLSIFHGPRVESSFSMMGNILDRKSGRISLQTYSAIQTVK